jgi:thiamine-phosphate pyrophosphorylase
MARRQPLPRLWLMTDERIGDALWGSLERLPRGAGIVFRHHATPPTARRALFDAVRRVARRRGLVLVLAGSPRLAVAWRADGAHGRSPWCRVGRPLIRTAPAHRRRELARDVDLVFLSPVFATRSHPGTPVLNPVRFGLMAHATGTSVIALGGMNAHRARRLRALGADGYAAIDAWTGADRVRT